VFVAGSRQVSQLPAEVTARLDAMIETEFQILVGDANSADKAVQQYAAAAARLAASSVSTRLVGSDPCAAAAATAVIIRLASSRFPVMRGAP
jgi:hypothetical protein